MKPRILLGAVAGAALILLPSCRIEPPLRLPDGSDIESMFPEVETDISVVWDLDYDWQGVWWYGWDDEDTRLFGPIDTYPVPSNYEARIYYLGDDPEAHWSNMTSLTVYGSSFRRRFAFGYHNMLFWSNIDSADGTQVLLIDETDADNILATTTTTRLTYPLPPSMRGSRSATVYNSPEVFYASHEKGFYVSQDPADYDYYDAERNVWVKKIGTRLTPLVYTYLVQVVVYNNNGRILSMTDNAALSSLAKQVSIHTGSTSDEDVTVVYPMRLKRGLTARGGKGADIFGGKLTTFGLCGMERWTRAGGHTYTGTRGDLVNRLGVNFRFHNDAESTFSYDVTEQLQRQAHGGVITIEIDADTITIPEKPSQATGGFAPVIVPGEEVEYEFPM